MKNTKSKAAYTNKWLSRNRCFWHEKEINGTTIIILDKQDAPKIVVERIKEINYKRGFSFSRGVLETANLLAESSHGSVLFNNKKEEKESRTSMSIYSEEELRQTEEEDEKSCLIDDDDIDYDEYDEYYDDD